MKKLEKVILYYIKSDDIEKVTPYVSLLGSDLKDNISWRIILPKNDTYNVDQLPFCPIFKEWLLQYFDGIKIANNDICNAILMLKDSLYIETSNYDIFSFKLTDKGEHFVTDSELIRDINKIGFIK
jgi:hypothetical protein